MRVVVTRPASDAATWVAALEAAGHTALSLPLIDIASAPNSDAIDQAWAQWPQWQAVMLVSAQAVRFFFARQPQDLQISAHPTRCWATGPGTRKALLQAGVPPNLIDSPPDTAGQFDSEALWQGVTSSVRPGVPVLVVRGTEADSAEPQLVVDHTGVGRDWLSQQLLHNSAASQALPQRLPCC
jgi:uroporphyrinogen-III synthase